jgi:hypothetical protein
MMGFQASGAAPIVTGARVVAPQTIATAIRIGNPASWQQALDARDESGGDIQSVTDRQILSAYRLLAQREGVFVEPASAASVAGLLQAHAPGSSLRRDGRLHRSPATGSRTRTGPSPARPSRSPWRTAPRRPRRRWAWRERVPATAPRVTDRPTGRQLGAAVRRLLRREKDFRRTYLAQLIALGGDWFAIIPLLILLPELTGSGLWGAMLLATDTWCSPSSPRTPAPSSTGWTGAGSSWSPTRWPAWPRCCSCSCGPRRPRGSPSSPSGSSPRPSPSRSPPTTAALPNLVDPEDLATASILNGASWGTMLAVGAALGGTRRRDARRHRLLRDRRRPAAGGGGAHGGDDPPFTDPGAPVRERRPVRHDLGEALGYARGEPRVLALIACKAGPAFGNGAISLFPLYGAAAFGLGPLGIGLMFSARGVGALLGPLLLRRQGTDPARLFAVLAGSMSVFGVAYLLLGATRQFWLVLLLLVLAHAGGGANWILSTYGMQRVVPDALRGRVFSADYTLATLVIACSQVSRPAVRPSCRPASCSPRPVRRALYAGAWGSSPVACNVPDDLSPPSRSLTCRPSSTPRCTCACRPTSAYLGPASTAPASRSAC